MNRKDSGSHVLIVVIVVLAVAILAVLGWLFWQNFVNKPSSSATITNFEECKAASGSKILETFPEQCVTADGRTFTGPTETDELLTYCTEAEKLCFEYPKSWEVNKLDNPNAEPGSKTDLIEIKAPDDEMILSLETGFGGLGGSCPDESKVSVRVLEATPAASLSGYADQYNTDMPYVARVAYPQEGKFRAALYLTTSAEYSTAGTIEACGIGFSAFIQGRNSVLSPDFDGAGAFTFGNTGQVGTATYNSLDDAIAAFDTPVYTQGASILASSHYE